MPDATENYGNPESQSETDFEDAAPNAAALIESMRAYGYTVPTAIADLMDNSIAAGCTTVWLDFHWSGSDSWIRVADDGRGMTEAGLWNAMRLGSRNPRDERDAADLGRFGLGMKTASLSQCRRLTVASRKTGGAVCARRWDLDFLAESTTDGWHLLKSEHPDSTERLAPLNGLDHGTVVLWEVLDRIVGDAARDRHRVHKHFNALVQGVEQHVAMVFHRYLTGPGRPRLRVILNDKAVKPWNPFLENHEATWHTPVEPIPLDGHVKPVVLQGFVLPHKDKLGDEAHQNASGPAGWNAQQGFYLYRNERLIIPGSWLGLGGSRPWTKEEHYKLARIRLDVPNSMDHLWQLDVKKSSAQPPALLRERLQGLAQTVRQEAREVYAHRGTYGPRARRHELQRPWKVVRSQGTVRYRIDRTHPTVEALLASIPEESRKQLEAALRIIEETVPVERIWLDTADQQNATNRPFRGRTGKQNANGDRIGIRCHPAQPRSEPPWGLGGPSRM